MALCPEDFARLIHLPRPRDVCNSCETCESGSMRSKWGSPFRCFKLLCKQTSIMRLEVKRLHCPVALANFGYLSLSLQNCGKTLCGLVCSAIWSIWNGTAVSAPILLIVRIPPNIVQNPFLSCGKNGHQSNLTQTCSRSFWVIQSLSTTQGLQPVGSRVGNCCCRCCCCCCCCYDHGLHGLFAFAICQVLLTA